MYRKKNAGWLVAIDVVHVIVVEGGGGDGGSGVPLTCTWYGAGTGAYTVSDSILGCQGLECTVAGRAKLGSIVVKLGMQVLSAVAMI